jgi:hypothetical protein
MPSKLIDPEALPTMSFDWGVIKPLVAADNTDDPAVSLMHVVLLPGQGHERHNQAVFHSTVNTGWEPLSLLAIYAPAGAEQALKGLPDYREIPAGDAPPLATRG